MSNIYGLYGKDGSLRYIGKANNPGLRLKAHLREAFNRQRQTPVYDWIRKHGQPELRILEADCEDWQEAEKRLIAEHRAAGAHLLNIAEGGDQPFCPPEVRSANGHRLVASMRGDTFAAWLAEKKRRIQRARREGYLSNYARDGLREAAHKCPQLFGLWENIPTAEQEYGLATGTPEWLEWLKTRKWQKRAARGI